MGPERPERVTLDRVGGIASSVAMILGLLVGLGFYVASLWMAIG